MNKRGTTFSQYVPEWIYKAVLMVIITVFVLFLVRIMSSADVHAENLRAESFLTRVLYSPDGFSYVDDLNRTYPKTIDFDKWRSTNPEQESLLLNQVIDYGGREFIAAKFELDNLDTNLKVCPKVGGCSDFALYYNKEKFENWLVYSFDRKQFFKLDKQIYVLIRQNGEFQRGRLKLQVVTPVG